METQTNTTTDTTSIEELVNLVDKKRLILPEFQRDFLWPIEKSKTLFDSLFRNLFIGSIILSKPSFELACKELDLRERGSRARKPTAKAFKPNVFIDKKIDTILDGQQRTTALYRALKGIDQIYLYFKPAHILESSEYYDAIDGEGQKAHIMDYVDGFETKIPKDSSDGKFYISIEDLFHGGKHLKDKKFLGEYVDPVLNDMKTLSSDQKTAISDIALHVHNLFHTEVVKKEKLISLQLLDMDLESFCLYFERSNSEGLNLKFTDIITAKVYCHPFYLGREIEKARKTTTFLDNKKWWVEQSVRYLNFLDYGEVKKGSILENLKGDSFETIGAKPLRIWMKYMGGLNPKN